MLVQTAGFTWQFGEPFDMRNRQPLTFQIVGRVNPAKLSTTNLYTLIKITFFNFVFFACVFDCFIETTNPHTNRALPSMPTQRQLDSKQSLFHTNLTSR